MKDLQTTCIAAVVVGLFITSIRCFCRYYKMRDLGPEDWTCVVATVSDEEPYARWRTPYGNHSAIHPIGCLGSAPRHCRKRLLLIQDRSWPALLDRGPEERDGSMDCESGQVLYLLQKLANNCCTRNTCADNHVLGLEQTFWVAQLFYCWMQYFTKLSILLLYIRVFGVTRWVRTTCYGCIAALTFQTIPIFFIMFFQCQPLQAIWNKYIEGRCLDVSAIAYAGGALSIAWDVVLIALPIPEILKLQVSARKRLTLVVIFALASAASVTTIIRLRYVVLFNATYDPSCKWMICFTRLKTTRCRLWRGSC